MTSVDESRQHINYRLDNEFPFFARHVLKIKTKTGLTESFVFNQAQQFLHNALEKQLKTLGRIRALIVKGRQQGCSTYIEGRYYWKAVRKKGKYVFILSHESETTKKLFKMVERYWELSPGPTRPEAKIANRREFEFKDIGSEYAVGTAGNENVGRGGTVQLFHGSEVAFWEKTQGIKTGILQSVPDMADTEVILESTANGMSNAFYTMCMEALDGRSDYQVIFIPWYWQAEYKRDSPADGIMELTDEEVEYMELYSEPGQEINKEQMYWRRAKVVEFGEEGDWMFKQEYPAFLQEAFQTSGRTLISPQAIIRGRKTNIPDDETTSAPLILGVDPARTNDRIILAPRQGRKYWPHIELKYGKNEEQISIKIAQVVSQWILKNRPQKVFIDVGEGWGVIDQLKAYGHGKIVEGVHFGSSASDKVVYGNKRAEIWCRLADHIHGEEGPIDLPNSDELQKDLMAMPEAEASASGKKRFPPKALIKKNLGCSPDIGDAYALTHTSYVLSDPGAIGVITKKNKSLVTTQKRYNGGRAKYRRWR